MIDRYPARAPRTEPRGRLLLRRSSVVGIAAISVLLMAAAFVLPSQTDPDSSSVFASDPIDLYFRIAFGLLVVSLAAVGMLVAIRRPEHPIGWLFLVCSVLTAFSIFGGGVSAVIELRGGEPSFGAVILLWASTWTFAPAIGILAFIVPLVFPTGRFLSPRWRVLAWVSSVAWALATIQAAFRAGPIEGVQGMVNPFGITALTPIFDIIDPLLAVTPLPVLGAIVASVVIRYRRAGPVERQQLRWFLYPATVAAIAFGIALSDVPITVVADLGWTAGIGAIALVPPAIGVAILRHRLFEIDRIMSRTLTYAVVTAVLIGVYLAAVLMLQFVLAPLSGGNSPLIVAASTLLVAALVRPILRRVRRLVDRRFNRSRYDGEMTVRALATRLRDMTDLSRVAEALTEATAGTLAPRTISVWLLPRRGSR